MIGPLDALGSVSLYNLDNSLNNIIMILFSTNAMIDVMSYFNNFNPGGLAMSFLRSLVKRITPVLVSVLLLVGVATVSSPALANTVSVAMGEGGMLAYSPSEVTISPGDTVHFDVIAIGPHNVVFDPANSAGDVSSLSHPALEMSGGFDVTFPEDATPGTYSYYCDPHRGAGMVGKITVQ